MITVERYMPGNADEWNDFVLTSRNGTFLHDRRYMDYHSDRFDDHSLMARDSHGHLLAVLPACRDQSTLYSHRGLTFGGWLMPPRRCDALDMMEIWSEMTRFLKAGRFERVVYKAIPHIYHTQPAEEDLYAVFRAGGRLTASLVSSVVDLDNPLPFDQGSRQRIKKAISSGVTVSESDRWSDFWQVLTSLLQTRYGTVPVHSLAEITMLRDRFPDNIRLYTASLDGELLAGIVIYVSKNVAHSQYTAASPRGKELSVLPALYRYIMDSLASEVKWFDFGTSNENNGLDVNAGLLRQKCSYGGRAVVYNTFTIDL